MLIVHVSMVSHTCSALRLCHVEFFVLDLNFCWFGLVFIARLS